LTTNFVSTSLPGSGSIASYVWDFGDGSTGAGDNPSHTYLVSGCKNVTLIITNTYGCISDTTLTNLLCVYKPPVSSFTASVQSACAAPFTTTYQANPTGGTAPYTYHWLFAGGMPATSMLANPSVNYNSSGSFSTTLITTDAHGCSDTVTKSNYIAVANNSSDFTLGADLHCAPASISVNGISSLNPLAWQWQVSAPGTAVSASAQNTAISLPDSGSYNVCLNISYSGGCTAQKCSTIFITAPPVAYFGNIGNLNTCQIPDEIEYIDSSLGNGLTYQWAFCRRSAGKFKPATATCS
jgi:PKD repeat protein